MKGKYGILSLLPYPNIPPPLSLEKSPYPFPILYKSFNSVPRIITPVSYTHLTLPTIA